MTTRLREQRLPGRPGRRLRVPAVTCDADHVDMDGDASNAARQAAGASRQHRHSVLRCLLRRGSHMRLPLRHDGRCEPRSDHFDTDGVASNASAGGPSVANRTGAACSDVSKPTAVTSDANHFDTDGNASSAARQAAGASPTAPAQRAPTPQRERHHVDEDGGAPYPARLPAMT